MIVQLTKEQLAEVASFCDKVTAARKKRDIRNNDTGDHRIKREMIGKIGEYGVAIAIGIGSVDFKIYSDGQVNKNCQSDLAPGVHVKTCNLESKGKRADGWLISISERLLTDSGKSDIVIFCYASLAGAIEVVGWLSAAECKQYLRPPVNRNLQHKLAIYASDVDGKLMNISEVKQYLGDNNYK